MERNNAILILKGALSQRDQGVRNEPSLVTAGRRVGGRKRMTDVLRGRASRRTCSQVLRRSVRRRCH
jgi:hypothetical protein